MKIGKKNEYRGETAEGELAIVNFEDGQWLAKTPGGKLLGKHQDFFVLKSYLGIGRVQATELQPA